MHDTTKKLIAATGVRAAIERCWRFLMPSEAAAILSLARADPDKVSVVAVVDTIVAELQPLLDGMMGAYGGTIEGLLTPEDCARLAVLLERGVALDVTDQEKLQALDAMAADAITTFSRSHQYECTEAWRRGVERHLGRPLGALWRGEST